MTSLIYYTVDYRNQPLNLMLYHLAKY